MPSRKIQHLPLADLKVDPRNPKAHSIETIDASVGRFGFIEPIVLDERTGFIVSGHGRTETLRVMQERGDSPPEGIRRKGDDWLVPVTVGWASRSDTEARAALIALNRAGEVGGWVDDELLTLLDELSNDEEYGFDGVGFGQDDLDKLTARLEKDAIRASDVNDYGEHESIKVGRASLVLNYSRDEYETVTALLDNLRAELAIESNAEAVLWLLQSEARDRDGLGESGDAPDVETDDVGDEIVVDLEDLDI